MNQIVYYSSKLFYFILSFLVIVILIMIFSKIFLRKYDTRGSKLKLYGLFLGLTTKDVFSLSLLTIRYIFFIWCLYANDYTRIYEDIYFYILLVPNIFYDIINKKYLNIIGDVLNNVIIYFALFFKMILHNYLIDVDKIWYVALVYGVLIIFTMIYGSYFYFKDIDYLMKENKYIKKKIDLRRE